jgi:hypothetical protein
MWSLVLWFEMAALVQAQTARFFQYAGPKENVSRQVELTAMILTCHLGAGNPFPLPGVLRIRDGLWCVDLYLRTG